MLDGKRILLVISGGIAAYKSLIVIRRLRERGARVRCVLTRGGAEFVTPLSVAALSHEKVYGDIFSLTDESEMGHLRLSQEADLVVVAPATADILAKMAAGITDELATTVLLASAVPILVAPAMNHRMWRHPATRTNLQSLAARGVLSIGPNAGSLAEDETGIGRMAEPEEIVAAVTQYFAAAGALAGRRALVTSGPTYEAVDPVRFIGNRSSGKQGHAIAAALAARGAATTLVTGPTAEPDPPGVQAVPIRSAREMLAACQAALPADVVVCAAAVSDWRPAEAADQKIKKDGTGSSDGNGTGGGGGAGGGAPPEIRLVENPDILATLARGDTRPALVIGFAAETQDVIANARAKLARKGCDWIVANDVAPGTGTFGGEDNTVHLVTAGDVEDWPRLSKAEVADRLADRIAASLPPAAAAKAAE